MPSSTSLLRRLVACAVFAAFLLGAVFAHPRPAAAAPSGRTWTIITLVVVACFVLPATPCHPLGKVAGATPPERTADCSSLATERTIAAGSALEEGAPIHMLLRPGTAKCGTAAQPALPAQTERTGNDV